MAVSEKLIETLNELLMLDHDAVEAYQQAIDRINTQSIRQQLSAFQADHRRHITDLNGIISRYGGKPKDRTDVKGFFIKGMTAVQSMMGDEMALKAMQTNEKLTNSKYEAALHLQGMPDDVLAIVRRGREDEARHLQWIEKALSTRMWETGAAHP